MHYTFHNPLGTKNWEISYYRVEFCNLLEALFLSSFSSNLEQIGSDR